MGSGWTRWPIGLFVATLCLLTAAPGALAAAPIKGGRYAGQWSTGSGKGDRYIAFNVDARGRAFVSDPRLVFQGSELDGPCVPQPWDLGGVQRRDVSDSAMTLSAGTPVRVRADGSFSLAAATKLGGGVATLRLSGRFGGSGKVATGSFRVSAPRAGGRCAKQGTFTARFTGQWHLTVGGCPPRETTTLADNGQAVVYGEEYDYDQVVRNNNAPGASPPYDPGGAVYGCLRGTVQQWFLASTDFSNGLFDYYGCAEHVDGVTLAGDLAAFALYELCQPGVPAAEGRSVDLRTGTVFREGPATVGQFPPQASDGSRMRSGVASPNGSAAWIVCTVFANPQLCQVVDEVANGPSTVLDQGDQIDPTSLGLGGTTLTWRDGGQTRTASLT